MYKIKQQLLTINNATFMFLQAARIVESLLANVADMRGFTRVHPDVDRQISVQCKWFAAIVADVRPFAAVRSHVALHLSGLRKRPVAHLANKRLLAGVGQNVQLHVADVRERLRTIRTLVGFFFRVDFQVGLKIVFAEINRLLALEGIYKINNLISGTL